jgi:predicted enzyme related to lactoylglutathione lyase
MIWSIYNGEDSAVIKITVASVFVDDQAKALEFYTDVLGFVRKMDVPAGAARWLTVVSPADPDGVELLLEPNGTPVARAYQEGLYQQGITATTFASDDVHKEYERLKERGVKFISEPTQTGPVIGATFDDTCGNVIGLHQVVT